MFHINFWILFSMSVKKGSGIFVGIALILFYCFTLLVLLTMSTQVLSVVSSSVSFLHIAWGCSKWNCFLWFLLPSVNYWQIKQLLFVYIILYIVFAESNFLTLRELLFLFLVEPLVSLTCTLASSTDTSTSFPISISCFCFS